MDSLAEYKTPKLTFYYLKKDKRGETFFDAEQFNWTSTIEMQWEIIYDEVITHLQTHEKQFGTYFDDGLVNKPGKWRSFGFYFWGTKLPDDECKHFLKTISLLKTIPDVVSASVSVMEPYAEIKPHYGDTDAIFRCHLPLIVPGILPEVGFQVGYEKRSWQEGKLLIFNDAAYHKGWNNTNKKRVVFIFDVLRPDLKNRKRWICSQALSNITLQNIFSKMPFSKRLPLFIIKAFHKIISINKFVCFSFMRNKFI